MSADRTNKSILELIRQAQPAPQIVQFAAALDLTDARAKKIERFLIHAIAVLLGFIAGCWYSDAYAGDGTCFDTLMITENAATADDSRTMVYAGQFLGIDGDTLRFQNAPCAYSQDDSVFVTGFEDRATWKFSIQTFAVMPFHIGPVLCESSSADHAAAFICGPVTP